MLFAGAPKMKTGSRTESASIEDKYSQPVPDLLTVMSVCNKAQINEKSTLIVEQQNGTPNKKKSKYV